MGKLGKQRRRWLEYKISTVNICDDMVTFYPKEKQMREYGHMTRLERIETILNSDRIDEIDGDDIQYMLDIIHQYAREIYTLRMEVSRVGQEAGQINSK